jgi:4-hydroxybenzoate polyprenyltransferase
MDDAMIYLPGMPEANIEVSGSKGASPDSATTSSKPAAQRTSDLRFLLQVSRPGLWSTTALFYLMPLGHADFLHSGRVWLGLIFVLFPLSFLLYGVNDIADAKADRLNPRKGT